MAVWQLTGTHTYTNTCNEEDDDERSVYVYIPSSSEKFTITGSQGIHSNPLKWAVCGEPFNIAIDC